MDKRWYLALVFIGAIMLFWGLNETDRMIMDFNTYLADSSARGDGIILVLGSIALALGVTRLWYERRKDQNE